MSTSERILPHIGHAHRVDETNVTQRAQRKPMSLFEPDGPLLHRPQADRQTR
jgi:hypothetical protein